MSFYESFGFVRTADVVLGEDNPKWENPPVVVPLVGRSFPPCIGSRLSATMQMVRPARADL